MHVSIIYATVYSVSVYILYSILYAPIHMPAACTVKATDLCLPIAANCGGGIFSEFVINQEHYLFQELFSNNIHFNLTYDHLHDGFTICFKNITTNVLYIEFCPSHHEFDCTILSPSIDGELRIIRRAMIQLGSSRFDIIVRCIDYRLSFSMHIRIQMAVVHAT